MLLDTEGDMNTQKMSLKDRLKTLEAVWPALMAARKDVKKRVKVRTTRPDQVTNAGLAGLCLLIIAGNLGQRPDVPLRLAILCAFVALPGLVLGYVCHAFTIKGRGKLFVQAMRKGAQMPMCIAWIAVGLMLVFIALHYAGIYAVVFVGSIVLMGVLWFVGVTRTLNLRLQAVIKQAVIKQAQPESMTPEQFVDTMMFGDGQHEPAVATVAASESEHAGRALSSENDGDDVGAHRSDLSARVQDSCPPRAISPAARMIRCLRLHVDLPVAISATYQWRFTHPFQLISAGVLTRVRTPVRIIITTSRQSQNPYALISSPSASLSGAPFTCKETAQRVIARRSLRIPHAPILLPSASNYRMRFCLADRAGSSSR
jgi:hypothetical protein